jgi:hypothetical protein
MSSEQKVRAGQSQRSLLFFLILHSLVRLPLIQSINALHCIALHLHCIALLVV